MWRDDRRIPRIGWCPDRKCSDSFRTSPNSLLANTAGSLCGTMPVTAERRVRVTSPVLIIGAGKVGHAASRALKARGVEVHAIDRSELALEPMREEGVAIFPGDAADRRVLERAGIQQVSSVLLTTNDDAVNIYLAVYCRRLTASLRIVSRITHERNVEAIHRAGADFVLSYATLGVESVMSLLRGYELVVLGEGVELFSIDVPASLAGRRLADSGIGSSTGMSVVALDRGGTLVTRLTGETLLEQGSALVMLGSLEQRRKFAELFENAD